MTTKPKLMLTKRFKSAKAAQTASQRWADKLGVSVGARGPAKATKAKKHKAAKRKNAGRPRTKTGQFKRVGRRR